jgi:DNA-binding transcriptional LysR family regulator
LRDIAGNPWIIPQAQLPMRSLLEQVFADEGLPFPAYAIETSSTFATLSLLRAGEGTIGMIPLQVAQYFADCGLIGILPIGISRTGAPYGIATRRGAALTQPVQMFIDICRERAEALEW